MMVKAYGQQELEIPQSLRFGPSGITQPKREGDVAGALHLSPEPASLLVSITVH